MDLRWGIPDEAKAEGKVLPLCLAEIERCRPYFIGLLGERYGWVPEEIPDELLEAQPWLTKYRKESVTALEILHGVLLNRDMSGHAFFYFRDPACAALHAGFTEDDPARRDRLAVLKDGIRQSGFPVAENFATPKQLGEWVLRDITAVIENLYPESSVPDPLDRAAADHEAYAASRRRVYIGRGPTGQITVTGKGRRVRVVLLPEAVWEQLQKLPSGMDPDSPVFRSRSGAALDRSRVLQIVREAARRAALPERVSPHWLRHAHASHALDHGAPLHLVQATLGHASVATTSRYLHVRPNQSSAAYLFL